jgi:hypothetical protein
MIDHVVVSNEMNALYMGGTAMVLTDVTSMVTSYGTTTSDHYPIFSRFAFDPVILPVTLVEFTGTKRSTSVELKWKTVQEINSKEFIVEHSSDGRNFTAIGTVAAAGNSNGTRTYSFIDHAPKTGKNFYRLRMVDKDGKATNTRIVTINFGTQVYVNIRPNPASSVVNVSVANASNQTIIQVFDQSGKLHKTYMSTVRGNQVVPISVSGLSKGIYLMKVFTNNEVVSEKLIVQ